MTTTTEWPAGVIARYLTIGGATADVISGAVDNRPQYNSVTRMVRGACTGERCHESYRSGRYTFNHGEDPETDDSFRRDLAEGQRWAQSHAERCRAMPRPA